MKLHAIRFAIDKLYLPLLSRSVLSKSVPVASIASSVSSTISKMMKDIKNMKITNESRT